MEGMSHVGKGEGAKRERVAHFDETASALDRKDPFPHSFLVAPFRNL
jgi:hypothetical protein